ncbi:MFS transporter [Dictyobacter kobayashii]|uniref:MFS transporter n=1 Tax=Dictyobacter kobayashii TaxID=2014872 RepID=A0A402AVE5_9CHLR|nr:MFS transporter [Dictyobacter kobayashii]GCE23086.1 MFS transporter [Dictyobacter kobayashii]
METVEEATPLVHIGAGTQKKSLLHNRNFVLLWSGQCISLLGDFVFDTTLVLWISNGLTKNQPWSPLAVSILFLMTTLPAFLFGPVAGVFVDRWNKRQTMLRMDLLRAGLIFLLFAACMFESQTFIPHTSSMTFGWLGGIYVIVLLATICAQFFNPSRLALVGEVVAEEQRTKAMVLMQMTMSLALILGPSLAAFLFALVGVKWALLLNAVSFLLSFVAVRAINTPAQEEKPLGAVQAKFMQEFRAGLQFCVTNRVLSTLLIALVLATLGAGSIYSLNVFFAQNNLHASIAMYGLLGSFYGIGSVVGALLAGLFVQKLGMERTFWLSLVVFGGVFLCYARSTELPLALFFFFLLGIPNAAISVALMPLILQVTPRELVGRITSVLMPLQSLALMISVVCMGYLDSNVLKHVHLVLFNQLFGPVDTLFTMTALLIIGGGLFTMLRLTQLKKAATEAPEDK